MLDLREDIQPLTTFRNNSVKMMRQLKRTRRPMVLTVNGRPEAVVQDAAAYQALLDLAAKADAGEGVRQGFEDAKAGRVSPAREAFADFRKKRAIPG